MQSSASRVLAALCAAAVVVVPIAVHADARATTAPPLDVELYPLQNPDPVTAPSLFVADGGLWSLSGDDVHRVDPAAGPLVGYLTPSVGPSIGRRLADGIFWSVVVDPNGAPCASPRSEENPDAPYVLRGIDVATGASAALVPLGWCQWRPSRTLDGIPYVVAGGGTVWISRTVPYDPATGTANETVRVDAATGAIARLDPHDAPLVVAADGRGLWGMNWNGSGSPGADAYGGSFFFASPLARIDRNTSAGLADALHGGYWDPTTLEPDPDGAWVARAKRVPRFGGALDPILTRVTTAGRVTTVATVRPWSIASDGDGRTWFLGTTHRVVKSATVQPVEWVLGRVDTRTGKHLRTYHLDLPAPLGTVTTGYGHPLVLLGATGGAVWLSAGSGFGTLVRVTARAPASR